MKPKVPKELIGLHIGYLDEGIVIFDANWKRLTGSRYRKAYDLLNVYIEGRTEMVGNQKSATTC